MKKLLSIVLAITLVLSVSITAFAAEATQLGSDGFSERMSSNGTLVNKNTKTKDGNVKIMGYYHAADGKEVVKIVNQERAKAGLHALKWDDTLVQPSIQRALEQYVTQGHTRPNGSQWYTVSSYAHGENVAGGMTSAEEVMDAWIASPDHQHNIMLPEYVSMAAVCVETDKAVFWVQLFHKDPAEFKKFGYDPEEIEKFKGGEIDKLTIKGATTKDTTKATKATTTSDATITAANIGDKLTAAKTAEKTTILALKNAKNIPADAITAAKKWATTNGKSANISNATTSNGKTVGVLKFNPANISKIPSKGINALVRVTGKNVDVAKASFAKQFKGAKAQAISLTHTGSFGGFVSISAKADSATGLDTTKKMYAYLYNPTTLKLSVLPLDSKGVTADKNGFIKFTTSTGGDIIITNKQLIK